MLRIADIADYKLVEDMSFKFIETTGYTDYYDKDTISRLIEHILTSPNETNIILLHGEDGMLAGMTTPFVFGTQTVATEIGWWVEPDKRKSSIGSELLEAFEFWAKKVGASFVSMGSLDDSLGKFYEKRGYKLYERAYMKVI